MEVIFNYNAGNFAFESEGMERLLKEYGIDYLAKFVAVNEPSIKISRYVKKKEEIEEFYPEDIKSGSIKKNHLEKLLLKVRKWQKEF